VPGASLFASGPRGREMWAAKCVGDRVMTSRGNNSYAFRAAPQRRCSRNTSCEIAGVNRGLEPSVYGHESRGRGGHAEGKKCGEMKRKLAGFCLARLGFVLLIACAKWRI